MYKTLHVLHLDPIGNNINMELFWKLLIFYITELQNNAAFRRQNTSYVRSRQPLHYLAYSLPEILDMLISKKYFAFHMQQWT